MRTIGLLTSVAVLAAALVSPAFAGSPDNPGAGGQEVSTEAQNAPSTYGTKNFGEAVSTYVQQSDSNLGDAIKAWNDANGGSPNPSNDSGSGND